MTTTKALGTAAALTAALLAATLLREPAPDPFPGFPRLVLWAWERPESMAFLDPRAVGVAFLARTIRWRNGVVDSRPRLEPLRVPARTQLMAVVRLESDGGELPDSGFIARETARTASLAGIRALQVDFDARRSEQPWYRAMLAHVSRLLPPDVPIGITALVSWCQSDRWMSGLPVRDAVPMLFRMGPGQAFPGSDFRDPLCRASTGISTDELPRAVPRGRRLFVFHPRPWTRETYRGALELARRWR